LNVAKELDEMKRVPTLLTVVALMACCAPLFSAAAQTVSHTPVKPKSAQGHKAPMRHDQLTLYPHGRPARRQSAYGYTRHRFDQPTPIHNTFMGVRRW
jgi:Spy/CpxP family protein refolding chaperone